MLRKAIQFFQFIVLFFFGIALETSFGDSKYEIRWQNFKFENLGILSEKKLNNNPVKKNTDNFCDNKWTLWGPEGGCIYSIAYTNSNPHTIIIGTFSGSLYMRTKDSNFWQMKWTDTSRGWFSFDAISDIAILGNRLYIGGPFGLYYSPDFGNSWQKLYYQLNGTLTSIAINEQNPDIIFIGYDLLGASDIISQPGVKKTTDGGKTWQPFGEGLTGPDVIELKFFKNDPGVLYAATSKGLCKTIDGDSPSWKNISGSLSGKWISAIEIDPNDKKILYAATSTGIYKSLDSGDNWQDITGPNFKSKGILQKCLVVHDSILFCGTINGLYKSTDGGNIWYEKIQGLKNTAVRTIEIMDKSTIYLGTYDGFYLSQDGGENWTPQNHGINAFRIHSLAIDNIQIPSQVYIGTNGAGIYKGNLEDNLWTDLDIDSGFLHIPALSIQPQPIHRIYASFITMTDSVDDYKTGLFIGNDSILSWRKADRGLENNIILAITQESLNPVLYAATLNGVFKSENGGEFWQRKNNGIHGNVVWTIQTDPVNMNIIYAGTSFENIYRTYGIYKSIDYGELWQYVNGSDYNVFDFCINPLNSNSIYAASAKGVYKSIDGGKTWLNILNVGTNSITIDCIDTNYVYVAGNTIYKSENAGQSWERMIEGMPEYFGNVHNIRIDPGDPKRIYAATDGYGLYTYYRHTTEVVYEPSEKKITAFSLYQNYPNPFNPATTIRYKMGTTGKVSINIYNVHGQLVRKILEGFQPAGIFTADWDGLDDTGNPVSSGIYLCRMVSGDFIRIKKMILVQ